MVVFLVLAFCVLAMAQSAEEWADKGFNATDPELKIEYYTKAIGLDPEYAKAYNNRGWAYYLIGDYTRYLSGSESTVRASSSPFSRTHGTV